MRYQRSILPLLAWFIASACIVAINADAYEPRVLPDELCHLGWVHHLSDRGGFYPMGFASYCPPGYGLLLTPISWFTSEYSWAYQAILVLNALIGGACLLLARRLVTRHFEADKALAWLVGIAAVIYPSLLAYSRYALPETVLYALVLCWLSTWCAWIEQKDPRSLALLTAATVALYSTHSRMLVVVGFFLAAVCIAAIKEPRQRARYLAVVICLLASILALRTVKAYALNLGWEVDATLPLERLIKSFQLEELLTAFARIAGQLLTISAISAGLALIPFVWICSELVRTRLRLHASGMLKVVAAPTLLIMVALEAAIFFVASERFDLHFYARYVGPFAMACCVIAPSLITREKIRSISIWLIILSSALALLFLLSPPSVPIAGYAQIHVAGALPLVDWLATSTDRVTLILRVVVISAATACIAVGLMHQGRKAFVIATIVLAAMLASPRPELQDHPLDSTLPPDLKVHLMNPDCAIAWSDSIREPLQVLQRYRIEYLYPHCKIQELTLDGCPLPVGRILISTGRSRCGPPTRAREISMPPNLWIALPP